MPSPILPPEGAIEAEQAVLGSLLIDPDIAPYLFATVKPSDFLHEQNKAIFRAALDMFRKGTPCDAVTLSGALLNANVMDFSGNAEIRKYLAQLMEITPTSANWKEYAQVMRDKTTLWNVMCAASDLVAKSKTMDDCRQYAETINALLGQRHVHKPFTAADIYASFADRQSEPPPEYFCYGIPELDKMMFTESGDVVVIGGSSSSGKTAFALSVAWHIAEKRKVGFFSLETHLDKVSDRITSNQIKWPFGAIKSRAYQNDAAWWKKFAESSGIFDKRKDNFHLYTNENGSLLTLSDIEKLTRAYGYDAIFIDYIQELFPFFTGTVRGGIREKITELSIELHCFAQSTKTTVFELSQLSRPMKDMWTEPTMFDLKESGQLEQDADAVLLIYPPPKSHKTLDEKKNRFLKVAKNKEGQTGSLVLDFDGETQSFSVHRNDTSIMRDLSDAGRAAKARNRSDAQDAYYQPSFDDSDMPF